MGPEDLAQVVNRGAGNCRPSHAAASTAQVETHVKDRPMGGKLNRLCEDPKSAENVRENEFILNLPLVIGSHTSTLISGRGAANLDALLNDLKLTTSIESAPQVVLSGGSAGGTTVLYHADKIRGALATSGEIVAIPDAGIFLDLPNVEGHNIWPDQMRSLLDVANRFDDLDADCLARFPNDKQKCLFPEYYGDTIDTRCWCWYWCWHRTARFIPLVRNAVCCVLW